MCDSVPILCSSVLALHELTEKADCVLPVENQVRGIEGEGKRWEGGGGGAGGGRKIEVGRRRGSKFKQEVCGICKQEEGEEKMKLEVKYNL